MTTGSSRRAASPDTIAAVERSADRLTTAAYAHMEAHLGWYSALSAHERSWVGVLVHSGFTSFVRWYVAADNADIAGADVFADAPRALTRAISLRQTLDLLRTVVDVVEQHIPELAGPDEQDALREAVLRYSRDVAFAAAQVYADAAESRGAWDARLESLVVDAVLRGESDDDVTSRAAALGWDGLGDVTVVVGATPRGRADRLLDRARSVAESARLDVLLAVQGRRLVVVLGGAPDALGAARSLQSVFGPGPIVVGPTVPRLHAAGRSARAAFAGLRGAPGWPAAPRPVLASDLLPERVLTGDAVARRHLSSRVAAPLRAAGGGLYETATCYLERGRGVEATARVLYVHPNTVRYRLGRIAQVIGYDLADAREAYVVQIALTVSLLDDASAIPGPASLDAAPELSATAAIL